MESIVQKQRSDTISVSQLICNPNRACFVVTEDRDPKRAAPKGGCSHGLVEYLKRGNPVAYVLSIQVFICDQVKFII